MYLSPIVEENTRDGKELLKLRHNHSMETTGYKLLRKKIKLETGRSPVLDMFLQEKWERVYERDSRFQRKNKYSSGTLSERQMQQKQAGKLKFPQEGCTGESSDGACGMKTSWHKVEAPDYGCAICKLCMGLFSAGWGPSKRQEKMGYCSPGKELSKGCVWSQFSGGVTALFLLQWKSSFI